MVFDITVTDPAELTVEQVEHLYELSTPEKARQLLEQARQKGLHVLEVNPSYGAECTPLFRSIEVMTGHVWPISS